jgi:hypothetical protein
LKILIAILAAAAVLAGADATGKWSGTSEYTNREGEKRVGSALMILEQKGSELTGTAGPDAERQHAIENGKVDGQKLSFTVADSPTHVAKVELVMNGDALEGQASFEYPQGTVTMKLLLKRQ